MSEPNNNLTSDMKPSILVAALLLLRHILLLLPRRHRLVSLVAIKDLFLTLRFLLHGLHPITIHTASATLQMWVPLVRTNKPPLLLLHGFGSDARWTWERQITTLSPAFDLYSANLVFFGGSTSDSPDRSIAFQSKCVAEAMASLGVDKYSVAGISYGGFVAFRMAAEEAAEKVEKVVVMTSGVCSTAKELRELVEREGRDVSEILLPTTPEDLRRLVRGSMHKPPAWMPDFFLMDFIEVGD